MRIVKIFCLAVYSDELVGNIFRFSPSFVIKKNIRGTRKIIDLNNIVYTRLLHTSCCAHTYTHNLVFAMLQCNIQLGSLKYVRPLGPNSTNKSIWGKRRSISSGRSPCTVSIRSTCTVITAVYYVVYVCESYNASCTGHIWKTRNFVRNRNCIMPSALSLYRREPLSVIYYKLAGK